MYYECVRCSGLPGRPEAEQKGEAVSQLPEILYILWLCDVLWSSRKTRNTVHTVIVCCALVLQEDHEQREYIKQFTVYSQLTWNSVHTIIAWCVLAFRENHEHTQINCVMSSGLLRRPWAEEKYEAVHSVWSTLPKHCTYHDCMMCHKWSRHYIIWLCNVLWSSRKTMSRAETLYVLWLCEVLWLSGKTRSRAEIWSSTQYNQLSWNTPCTMVLWCALDLWSSRKTVSRVEI